MKDLPAGFEELKPGQSTREGGLFIRVSPFTVHGNTAYNAFISKDLYAALGSPARVKIAVNPENGKIIIHSLEVNGFKIHSGSTQARVSAAPLVHAGVPIKTRIYFTDSSVNIGSNRVYMSEATK